MEVTKEQKERVVLEVLDALFDYILITDRINFSYGGVGDFVSEFREFLGKKEIKND